jgi:hypothetical protein
MKKVVLSLAGVLAATAFAPEASALPAFARQTGLACNSCHFQHFPVLGTTGQEFKAGAYTQISAKGKFKSEDLSITDTMNAAILLKARYQKTSGNDAAGTYTGTTTNSGQFQIPDEMSFFLGGRIAEGESVKVGFMNENNMLGGPTGGMVAGFKMPFVVDAGAVKIMAIPYLTDALGMAYGYEQSSTGMTRGIRWAEHRKETSAAQYTGIGAGQASGLALVAYSDMGYVNLSKWSPQFAYAGGATGVRMSSTWLRVAATPTLGGWAAHIGLGLAAGTSSCADPLNINGNGATNHAIATDCETKGSVLDFQGQGELAGMETSLYVQYANAPASSSTGGKANLFNSKTGTAKKALTVGADFSVIPHTLHIGAAARMANTGVNVGSTLGDKDNAITVTAIYDLFQNVALHANYSMYSGSSYSTTGTNGDPAAAGKTGKSLLTLMLESAW